jgi:hypothetical protein
MVAISEFLKASPHISRGKTRGPAVAIAQYGLTHESAGFNPLQPVALENMGLQEIEWGHLRQSGRPNFTPRAFGRRALALLALSSEGQLWGHYAT